MEEGEGGEGDKGPLVLLVRCVPYVPKTNSFSGERVGSTYFDHFLCVMEYLFIAILCAKILCDVGHIHRSSMPKIRRGQHTARGSHTAREG